MYTNENGRYDIDVEADVLRDRINGLLVRYGKYIDDNNIDDTTEVDNPVVLKYVETRRLMNRAYNLKTYEEIDKTEEKFEELRRYYDAIL